MRNTSSQSVISAAVAAAVAAVLVPTSAHAVTYVWNVPAGGNQSWQVGTNWTPAGFPNSNLDLADLRVNLANNLTLDVGATDVTTSALYMGGTGPAVTTNVTSSGGQLILDNADTTFNNGNALLFSGGTAGSVNTISAPITFIDNASTDATSTEALTISGTITNNGGTRVLNHLSPHALNITGQINLSNDATTRVFQIAPGSGAGVTTISGTVGFGTGGATSGTLFLGSNSITSTSFVYPTVVLNNTSAHNNTNVGRVILDVRGDSMLGTGGLIQLTGATNAWGPQVTSTNGPRTITNTRTQVGQFTNFIGTNPITFSGLFGFSANRGITNFIPDDPGTVPIESLTFASDFYTSNTQNDNRVAVFAGPGNTVVNGNLIHNHIGASTAGIGSLEVRGTGTVTINGTGAVTAPFIRYQGNTRVRAGLLQFAHYGAMQDTLGATVEAGGAFGLLSGSIAGPDSAAFLNKLVAGAGLPAGGAGGNVADPNTSRGAIALAPADAAATIDFTAAPLNSANTVNMGIGAQAAGLTYTGTITPANNTYKLGGGGKLTLPNAQLTGVNNVRLDNGGVTALQGANTYTGVTTVGGNWVHPFQTYAAVAQGVSITGNPLSLRVNSTLEVTSLANGGSPSSIGSAGNAASNLVINGGTFRYAGTGSSSTDRLFTIGTNGATLDSSGAGTVSFTNTAALTVADAAGRTGTVETGNLRFLAIADVSDITPGMTVTGTNIPANTTVAAVQPAATFANFGGGGSNNNPYYVILSQNATVAGAVPDVVFGNQNRTLTLTGTNTGTNTVAGSLANSAAGTLAVNKTGAGTWRLSGANTYTGGTTVDAGALVAGHADAINTGQALTVNAGGTMRSQAGVLTALDVGTLTVAPTGRVDVNDGGLVKRNGGSGATGQTATQQITALLKTGLENGGSFDWQGPGISSTEAFNDNTTAGSVLFGVGVLQNNLASAGAPDGTTTDATAGNEIYTSFKGRTVALNDTLTRYTYMGDADLSGDVTGTDYSLIDSGFALSLSGWVNGDFDYSGAVDATDYALIDNAFAFQTGVLPEQFQAMYSQHAALFGQAYVDAFAAVSSGVVPEPAALSLLGLAGVGLLARRGRRA